MSNLFARIAKPFIAPAAALAGLPVFDVEADAPAPATKTPCIVVADPAAIGSTPMGRSRLRGVSAAGARRLSHRDNIGGYDCHCCYACTERGAGIRLRHF
jgi:hypothetical protein